MAGTTPMIRPRSHHLNPDVEAGSGIGAGISGGTEMIVKRTG